VILIALIILFILVSIIQRWATHKDEYPCCITAQYWNKALPGIKYNNEKCCFEAAQEMPISLVIKANDEALNDREIYSYLMNDRKLPGIEHVDKIVVIKKGDFVIFGQPYMKKYLQEKSTPFNTDATQYPAFSALAKLLGGTVNANASLYETVGPCIKYEFKIYNPHGQVQYFDKSHVELLSEIHRCCEEELHMKYCGYPRKDAFFVYVDRPGVIYADYVSPIGPKVYKLSHSRVSLAEYMHGLYTLNGDAFTGTTALNAPTTARQCAPFDDAIMAKYPKVLLVYYHDGYRWLLLTNAAGSAFYKVALTHNPRINPLCRRFVTTADKIYTQRWSTILPYSVVEHGEVTASDKYLIPFITPHKLQHFSVDLQTTVISAELINAVKTSRSIKRFNTSGFECVLVTLYTVDGLVNYCLFDVEYRNIAEDKEVINHLTLARINPEIVDEVISANSTFTCINSPELQFKETVPYNDTTVLTTRRIQQMLTNNPEYYKRFVADIVVPV